MNSRQQDKRPFDDDGGYGFTGEKRQRPPLTSDIIEAVQMDSLQKLCSSLEPMLRRIVSEEVEKAMSRMAPQSGALSLVQRSAFRQIIHGLGPYS